MNESLAAGLLKGKYWMEDHYGQKVVVGSYVVSHSPRCGVQFGVVTRSGGGSSKSITVCQRSGPRVRGGWSFVVVPRLCVPASALEEIHAALAKMKTKGEPVAVISPELAIAEDIIRSRE